MMLDPPSDEILPPEIAVLFVNPEIVLVKTIGIFIVLNFTSFP